MKPTKTWIVVTDGGGMRVFLNDGPGHGVSELEELARSNAVKPARDVNADKPGRVFDRGGEGRHAMEPEVDVKEHERQTFMKEVAEFLSKEAHKGSYDRLILVAPPKSLGDLRRKLAKPAAEKISAELSKDLIHLEARELAGHLGDVLAV
ncbi:MAG: host attachment protein [Methyloligellaceae bacterium]|nr:MAG: host attachment protein [Alphaproteobacteria bacterium]